ncbi:hypothetical protein KY290_011463 [Solanum tuberosum]|uniref:Uncharacterized protein n=1 Tax=Solanum tuberosum TaxID=4113 RepID=A0ABQ7W0P7_SOLTU|nr:hypothetical protein KY290_011463 [Solanum tuberosum]
MAPFRKAPRQFIPFFGHHSLLSYGKNSFASRSALAFTDFVECAEFPNNIELGKLGSSQDPNNNEHSTTSKRGES